MECPIFISYPQFCDFGFQFLMNTPSGSIEVVQSSIQFSLKVTTLLSVLHLPIPHCPNIVVIQLFLAQLEDYIQSKTVPLRLLLFLAVMTVIFISLAAAWRFKFHFLQVSNQFYLF